MIIPNIWENKKMFQTTNQYGFSSLVIPFIAGLLNCLEQSHLEMGLMSWGHTYFRKPPYGRYDETT